MSMRSFLERTTRERASKIICEIESETSVEIVITVRKAASAYFRTGAYFCVLVGCVVLAVLLFSPTLYPTLMIPLDTLLAIALGALVYRSVAPLRRFLTSDAQRTREVNAAADRAFASLGISKTRERTGILLYVALFERQLRVVADQGIDETLLGEAYAQTIAQLHRAVRAEQGNDFMDALIQLKVPLAQAYPRRVDDVNELRDEVV